jgi:hypothetical protein
MVIGQIRSGLAAGIFWSGLCVKNRAIKSALLLLACSIHTAFILLTIFYFLFHTLRNFEFAKSLLREPKVMVALLIVLAILTTVFRETALASIGDERAYQLLEYTSGIVLSLGWASFVVTYLMLEKRRELSFDIGIYAFSTAMALMSAIVGVYGARFISVVVPALAVMVSEVPPRYRILMVAHYVAFTLIYFNFWVR